MSEPLAPWERNLIASMVPGEFSRHHGYVKAVQWHGDNIEAVTEVIGHVLAVTTSDNELILLDPGRSNPRIPRGTWVMNDGRGIVALDDGTFRHWFTREPEAT